MSNELSSIILGSIGCGFILVYFKDIFIPFVVAIFIVYLLRPVVDFITKPWGLCIPSCCRRRCCTRCDLKVKGEYSPLPRYSISNSSNFLEGRKRNRSNEHLNETNYEDREMEEGCCSKLSRARCPQWLGVLTALMVASSFVGGLVLLIVTSIKAFQSNHMNSYEEQAEFIANKTIAWVQEVGGVDRSTFLSEVKQEFDFTELAKSTVVIIYSSLMDSFFIMLVVLYLMFEESEQHEGSLRFLIDRQIQQYIGLKTLLSILMGILVFIILGPLLNVELAHLFGVLTFLFNYIPNVGALVACMLPLPIVILDPSLPNVNRFLAIILPVVVHTTVGNFVEPYVFGSSMELHPIIVLLSLAFWYSMWGIPGAILSVPITAVMRIVLSHSDHYYAGIFLSLLQGELSFPEIRSLSLNHNRDPLKTKSDSKEDMIFTDNLNSNINIPRGGSKEDKEDEKNEGSPFKNLPRINRGRGRGSMEMEVQNV